MQAKPAAAESNGAGRDKDDLTALFHEKRNRADDRFNALAAELSVIGGDGARSDFDHDPSRGLQAILALRLGFVMYGHQVTGDCTEFA